MSELLVSVIVSTYNWPGALKVVLQGLSEQAYENFEVIVADDGSGQDTIDLVESFKAKGGCRLKHVWQEDEGFRLSAIRNKAVAAAEGEYLIFIDGDSVPLPLFIARHAKLAERGWFGAGSRILLSEQITRKIIENDITVYDWGVTDFLKARAKGWCNRLLPLISLPDGAFRKKKATKWGALRGCNLACWRDDYYKINGFDERYQGWGREDSDFAVRMINAGILRKDLRFSTPVIHLWHKENDRGSLSENDKILASTLENKKILAEDGIDKYLG